MTSERHAGHPARGVDETLADIDRLQTDRRYRDSRALFFIEGIRNFVTAFDCGLPITLVLVSDVLLTSSVARSATRRLRSQGIPVVEATPEQFRRVSRSERASGTHSIPWSFEPRWAPCFVRHSCGPPARSCTTGFGAIGSR
jgi:RNA methyltransferase, TrmH family